MATTSFGDLYKKAKAEGAFSDLIPDGDFRLEIKRANGGEAKSSGNPRIGVQFLVLGAEGGEELPDDDEAKGASSWLNLNFSEKAAPISFRQLREWGLDDEWLQESESVEQIAEALVGIVFDATVGNRSWGKDNENTDNTIKVLEIVVPPATGAAPIKPKAEPTDDGTGY